MSIIPIPANWTQEEINQYFNIRLSTIEKFMGLSVINFDEVICNEDEIEASSLTKKIKQEMKENLKAIGARLKKKAL